MSYAIDQYSENPAPSAPGYGFGRVCLWFSRKDRGDGHELTRTLFMYAPLGYSIQGVRGKYSGAYSGASTFQWSSAVQAVAVALVRAAARRGDEQTEPLLSGKKGTLASSLDYALYKQTAWLSEIFGVDRKGQSLANRMFKRTNPGRKQPGPVAFSLNRNFLQPDSITVFVDDVEVSSPESLEDMALSIEREWQDLHDSKENLKTGPEKEVIPVPGEGVRTLVFISPAMESKPFYADALEKVIIGAAKIRPGIYGTVPRLPSRSFDSAEIWQHFGEVDSGAVYASGVILIPDDPDGHQEQILSFCRKGSVPLVLFDVDMHRNGQSGPLPSFVGGNEELGGTLAAELIMEHISRSGVRNPVILVLKGSSTRWESIRPVSFSRKIREAFPDSVIIESEDLQYDRERARKASLRYFEKMQKDGVVDVDAVFACNDDMGLGARSAILHLEREGVQFRRHLGIVGYDGVKEMRDYLDNHDRWVIGTIDVKLKEQISRCLEIMQTMIEQGVRDGRVELVDPVVYRV